MEESKSIISHNLEQKFEPKSIFIQSHPFLNQSSKKIYQRVLAFSQLKLHHQISYRNVKIYQNQYIHQIYNIHPQKSQIPHLVFLHGFGGTSMTSIKLYKHLHNHFQIHALDCYGMGYSSRGNFRHNFSAQETKNYYINAIQEWRKALNINSFILVGHSFGGYLATCYSQMYPQKVDRLMLLSPAGFSSELRNTNQQETSFRQKFFYCLAQKIYNMNIRPSSAISTCLIGNRILNAILSNRLKLMDQQKEAWKEYFKHFTSQQKNSQVGFYRLFQWPLQPVESIEQIIKRNNFKFKIDFFYGDSDWMRRTAFKNYQRITKIQALQSSQMLDIKWYLITQLELLIEQLIKFYEYDFTKSYIYKNALYYRQTEYFKYNFETKFLQSDLLEAQIEEGIVFCKYFEKVHLIMHYIQSFNLIKIYIHDDSRFIHFLKCRIFLYRIFNSEWAKSQIYCHSS